MNIWAGIEPGYKDLIMNRIEESRREYNRKEQRAELLFRNPLFMLEYQKLQESLKHTDWTIKEVEKLERARKYDKALGLYYKCHEVLFRHLCLRWRISPHWDKEMASLSRFIEITPFLYHPSWATSPADSNCDPLRETDILLADWRNFPDKLNRNYLFIRIDPWTLPKDIRSAWGQIEKLKKEIFGFSDKDKWNFGEALCWYDLNKKHRWSFGKIALLWKQEKAPHEHVDDIKTRVRLGIKRISAYIQRMTLAFGIINVPQPEK